MPLASTSAGYRVLHSFGDKGRPDGEQPKAGLIELNGILYGTTYESGARGHGTVFSISTTGIEKVLYVFQGASVGDGEKPSAALIAVKGVLYGTTEYGGILGCDAGTVFSISTTGIEKLVYPFYGIHCNGYNYNDGAKPVASLLEVKGKLYGTTSYGGSRCYRGCGIVFSVTTRGKETVLHSFGVYRDGGNPLANLINVDGTLYGTTPYGGEGTSANPIHWGTVFTITKIGELVLHAFNLSDGSYPAAGLIKVGGILYGTTEGGGAYGGYDGDGTAFSITTTGSLTTLHSFGSGSDGVGPSATLLNVKGTLYGTTSGGGAYGKGTIFRISLGGKEKVLHSFGYGSDGATPLAGLIDVNGTLYGTTSAGGTSGNGTVFALTLR